MVANGTPSWLRTALEIFTHIVRSLSPFLRDLAYFIVLLWVYFLFRMTWQAYRVQKANKAILSILSSVSEASNEERVDGLPLERIQLIRTAIKDSNEHAREWWRSVEGALLPYIATSQRIREPLLAGPFELEQR